MKKREAISISECITQSRVNGICEFLETATVLPGQVRQVKNSMEVFLEKHMEGKTDNRDWCEERLKATQVSEGGVSHE